MMDRQEIKRIALTEMLPLLAGRAMPEGIDGIADRIADHIADASKKVEGIEELEGIYADTADEISRSIFLMAGKISELVRAVNRINKEGKGYE